MPTGRTLFRFTDNPMPKPTASVDKISFTIGGKKLELTLAEARELKKLLNETFEPVVNWTPAPIVIEREREAERWPRPEPTWMRETPLFGHPETTCISRAS